ncbi:MAG: tetratricopeptide repeat protein, partial [Planctomycetota bacterium]
MTRMIARARRRNWPQSSAGAFRPCNGCARWVACATLVALSLGAGGAYTLAQRAPYGERLYRQGLEAYQRKEYEKAIECFSQSLKAGTAQQTPETLYFARGRAYQQLGEQLQDAALACRNGNEQVVLNSEGARQFSSAWNDYDQILRTVSQFKAEHLTGKVYACLGYCYQQRNLDNEGGWAYRQALEAGFQSAELYNNLGCLHVAQGKREQAQACFRQAIELNPSLQAAYHNRAMLSLQIELARRNEAAPLQRLTAADVVRVFLQPAQPSDGLTVDIEKAISVGPVSADLYYNAAHLYVLAGTTKSYQVDRALNAWE